VRVLIGPTPGNLSGMPDMGQVRSYDNIGLFARVQDEIPH
jgi:hypothetical protein